MIVMCNKIFLKKLYRTLTRRGYWCHWRGGGVGRGGGLFVHTTVTTVASAATAATAATSATAATNNVGGSIGQFSNNLLHEQEEGGSRRGQFTERRNRMAPKVCHHKKLTKKGQRQSEEVEEEWVESRDMDAGTLVMSTPDMESSNILSLNGCCSVNKSTKLGFLCNINSIECHHM